MALTKSEQKEWDSLKAKSKRHGISVKRVGPANVVFPANLYHKEVHTQLGMGRATEIMDARIKVKKAMAKRTKGRK